MSENKTGKYFKYAVGEILLVVIGILIALQVSNWNEVRKSKNKIEAILDKFEDELMLTVRNANNDISNSVRGDSIIKRVLTNNVTREDYTNDERLRDLITWRFTLNPELDNLDKLLEKEEDLEEKYSEVLYDIHHFNFIREREVDAMNLLRISAEQNADYISLNFPWARLSDSLSSETAYRYFLTNENYKNRLYTHWVKCMRYNNIISRYRVEVLKILSKLKIIREGYSPSELETFLTQLGQKSFEKLEINKSNLDLVSNDKTEKSSLIINFTKDTLQIITKNKQGDQFWSRTAFPGKIYNTGRNNLDLDSDNLVVWEVYKNGICVEKYREVQYGFLLLQ